MTAACRLQPARQVRRQQMCIPSPRGEPRRHFSSWSPQELRQRPHPSIATEDDSLKSGFLWVGGWQCLGPAALVGFVCLTGGGHFLRVLSWGMHGIVSFPSGNHIEWPQWEHGPALGVQDGALGRCGVTVGAVTPRGSCCSGVWGTGGAVPSSPSSLAREQKKMSFFQGWFHASLGWHRAGTAWQDRGWQLCPGSPQQVLCHLPSSAQQPPSASHWPSSQPSPSGDVPANTAESNLTTGLFFWGLPGGKSPLGFTRSSLWLTRKFEPPTRCQGYIHAPEKCKVSHLYPGQQYSPEFSF